MVRCTVSMYLQSYCFKNLEGDAGQPVLSRFVRSITRVLPRCLCDVGHGLVLEQLQEELQCSYDSHISVLKARYLVLAVVHMILGDD